MIFFFLDFLAFHLGHIDGERFDFCLERVRPHWLFVDTIESYYVLLKSFGTFLHASLGIKIRGNTNYAFKWRHLDGTNPFCIDIYGSIKAIIFRRLSKIVPVSAYIERCCWFGSVLRFIVLLSGWIAWPPFISFCVDITRWY